MARGRAVVVVQAAWVLASAVAGSHAALGQVALERSGASVSLSSLNLLGLAKTTPPALHAGGASTALVLPGVSVSNLATVSATSLSLASSGANVVLPAVNASGLATLSAASVNLSSRGASVVLSGATVAGLATVTSASLNVGAGGVAVALPNVDVAGLSVSTTPVTVNLTSQGALLTLPALTVGVSGGDAAGLLGGSILGDTVSQLSPLTRFMSGFAATEAFTPLDQLIGGLAFGNEGAGCSSVDAAALAPPPGANLSTWNAAALGRAEHDGFRVNAGDGTSCGNTLPFETQQASRLPGMVWDASAAFGLQKGTLHIGLSGGVSETDTQIKASAAMRDAGIVQGGAARLTSWSAGGFSLLTKDSWYAGTAFGGAWGRTESQNFVLGSASDYETSAMVVAGFVGTIVPLTESLRFDLRGTLSYQRTVGDAHVDTLGVVYGDHTIEAADAVVSGRLFGIFRRDDVVWRPFLQAGVTHHLRYSNQLEIDGASFTLDEADTSIFAAGGLDFEISKALQLSVGVRHDYSRDLESTMGRLGISVRLN